MSAVMRGCGSPAPRRPAALGAASGPARLDEPVPLLRPVGRAGASPLLEARLAVS